MVQLLMVPSSFQGNKGNEEEDKSSRFVLDYANVTVMGRKLWDMLGAIAEADRPDAWAFVECHLLGEHLNAARRRLRKLGWKSLSTPAVPKADKDFGHLAGTGEGEADIALKKHQNSGGEMLHFSPGVVVHGHHQPKDAVGYRAGQVRFKGWTLHIVTIYLDCNFGIQEGQ